MASDEAPVSRTCRNPANQPAVETPPLLDERRAIFRGATLLGKGRVETSTPASSHTLGRKLGDAAWWPAGGKVGAPKGVYVGEHSHPPSSSWAKPMFTHSTAQQCHPGQLSQGNSPPCPRGPPTETPVAIPSVAVGVVSGGRQTAPADETPSGTLRPSRDEWAGRTRGCGTELLKRRACASRRLETTRAMGRPRAPSAVRPRDSVCQTGHAPIATHGRRSRRSGRP